MCPLLAIFTLNPWELIIVGVVVLLLFGSRLPGAMRSLGRGMVEFKKGLKDTDENEERPSSPPNS